MKLKKIMKSTFAVAMTLVVSLSTLNTGKIDAQAASSCVGIKCYNVQDNGGKGDATMLNCGNNRYILVDCGSAKDVDHLLTRIKKTCNKGGYSKNKNKIYISALILTHNHIDHMGGLEALLSDTAIHVGKIYYNKIAASEKGIEHKKTIKNLAKAHSVPTEAVSTKQILHIDPNNGEDVATNTAITVYGPAKDFTENKKEHLITAENNSSIIVDIHGKYDAILLGDLMLDGLEASIITYKSNKEIFKANYDLCKFGHHGMRRTYDQNEIGYYNGFIHAENYVFTASTEEAQKLENKYSGSSYYKNYSEIIPAGLNGKTHYQTFSWGNWK